MVQQVISNDEFIIPLRDGYALVASKSEVGGWHKVKVVGGVTTCDCTSYQYRENCRHVRAYRLLATTATPAPSAENPTFALAAAMLAGQFDGGRKVREEYDWDVITAGEDVSYGEWSERRAS